MIVVSDLALNETLGQIRKARDGPACTLERKDGGSAQSQKRRRQKNAGIATKRETEKTRTRAKRETRKRALSCFVLPSHNVFLKSVFYFRCEAM